MFAIIETGGKQYTVRPQDLVRVEKLDAEVGDRVEFDRVLLVSTDEGVTVGRPHVPEAKVVGRITQQGRGKKILVQKFKRRKKYRRLLGHRQAFTGVLIDEIILPEA
jgi:large subunit ribosomal protein L21